MAFGQQAGPPATARQIRRLGELLAAAGHPDFRSARAELGLNQRQAGGRFTRDEADELIALLEGDGSGPAPGESPTAATEPTRHPEGPARRPTPPPTANRARAARADLRHVASEDLAAELQRRGWAVLQP